MVHPQQSPVLAREALSAAESQPALSADARTAQEDTASVAGGIPSTGPPTPPAPVGAAPCEPAAGNFVSHYTLFSCAELHF